MSSRRHGNGSTVAHTEAAMEAGRDYENPNEGHKKMYDNVEDLMKKRDEPIKKSYDESRGARIDQELEEEDQQRLAQKDQSKEAHKHNKQHHY
ncbi:hypothetical protein BDB00DRAFT_163549 [Zychaea mexicana]|uniref:uncharacterized protein n=1 Tax=Zychaea mexicana TaxID=64656 RepID=UPI0022FE3215|nr:uncharacterized protein BDB00DRAFT_163549 [Zychaea mexicana]KAI9496118.1 hypothetical protein BDB00DRAFT_163549 [Zychaea mexicana]